MDATICLTAFQTEKIQLQKIIQDRFSYKTKNLQWNLNSGIFNFKQVILLHFFYILDTLHSEATPKQCRISHTCKNINWRQIYI